MPKITIDEFNDLLAREMGWAVDSGLSLESLGEGEAVMRLRYSDALIRPGGSISGPAMMMLADAVMYPTLMSAIGLVKMAVTTNFNINFLLKPELADLIAHGRALKIGRRLAVLEVDIFSDGLEAPVAHATGTYSIPPQET
jgi:uncharacterized protein (TIGR00369 family)